MSRIGTGRFTPKVLSKREFEYMATNERVIPATTADDGSTHYTSITSAPDDSTALCYMVPRRVIPVIFVPGVMGTNLQATSGPNKGKAVWLVNSAGGVARSWIGRGAETRKQKLDPNNTDVFGGGDIPSETAQSQAELRYRGWGTVAKMSYGTFLPFLENALNDAHAAESGLREQLTRELVAQSPEVSVLSYEEVLLSYKYQLPVHAVGYNWLQSNKDSAEHLADKIKQFTDDYKKKRLMCEKVIIVTHSMGGLVARYYSEVNGHRDGILGIVHGVMPTTGSATAYKRVVAGTDGGVGLALGPNNATMTSVFAQSPGPLQLLPSVEYGMGWLQIVDGKELISLPKTDPYEDIYLKQGKWWGLVDQNLINPSDINKSTIGADWENYQNLIYNSVKPFQNSLIGKFHKSTYLFYGDDQGSDYSTWGDVVWKRKLFGQGEFSKWMFGDQEQPIPDLLNRKSISNDGVGHQHLSDADSAYSQRSRFDLQAPTENGDGTVPIRSGKAPAGKSGVLVCLPYPRVPHEGAYKNRPQQFFALWAITRIIGNVKGTSLEYK